MLFNTSKVYKIQQTDQVLSIYIKSHGSFFALTSLPGVNYTLYVYSYVYVIGSNGDIVGKASLSLSLSLSLSRLEKFCAAPRLVAQRKRQGFLTSVTWVRASACTPVTPAMSYLPTGLAGCSVDPGISCGTRKLARTPRVTKKKKKEFGASRAYKESTSHKNQ